MSPSDSDSRLRLSDTDRTAAIEALGHALSEGRLDMVEYDERCQAAAAAKVPAELTQLFVDLPENPGSAAPTAYPVAARTAQETVYTASEVEQKHRSGARTRAGLTALAAVATTLGVVAVDSAGSSALAIASVTMILPVVWILLYVMKVGPTSWYTPSPAQLDRERSRARRRLERERHAQLRTERRQRRAELTDRAYNLADQSLDRLDPRHR